MAPFSYRGTLHEGGPSGSERGAGAVRPTEVTRLGAALAALGFAVLAGCGDDGSSGIRTPSASAPTTTARSTTVPSTTAPSTTAPSSTASPDATRPSETGTVSEGVLTERDDGAMVAMTVGDSVSLRVSSAVVWGVPELEGGAVTLHPVDHIADPGFQEWIIQAVASGTGVVRVQGAESADAQASVEITFTVEGP